MTQTVSFKDRLKQAFSFFKWDLKACSGFITVFSILAGVFIVIILTLCLVLGFTTDPDIFNNSSNPINSILGYDTDNLATYILIFQFISSQLLYFMTTIFTIIYTIKIFSYLHNKRKADMYGSLPIGRITLYFTKTACAYIFSVVPTLFFMGIISIISFCMGLPLLNEVSGIYIKVIMGALACITAYGLISVCCGTTVNSVVMFICVCISYPIAAMFINGIAGGFFLGLYTGLFKNHFIMNALNPLAAYDGINIPYWIIFSIVCLVTAAFLIKKRKAERAQSSFAYYLPCHIVKILISFISGMFLGLLFGSLNVFGNSYLGFIFGFLLGSVPAFIISHLIFYKGFTKLIKTSIILGGLIVFVIAGMAVCHFDLFGYNSFAPKLESIKSAGMFYSDATYINTDEKYKNLVNGMADDFSDKETKTEIINLYTKISGNFELDPREKYINTWLSMMESNIPISNAMGDNYAFSFRTNSGFVVTRCYACSFFNVMQKENISYVIDKSSVAKIVTQKKYVQKYSALVKAGTDNIREARIYGSPLDKDKEAFYDVIPYSYDDTDKEKQSKSDIQLYNKIQKAILKDIKEDKGDFSRIMKYRADKINDDWTTSYIYDEIISDYDAVCMLTIDSSNIDPNDFSNLLSILSFTFSSTICDINEYYLIPKDYENTIKVLKEEGILVKDNKIDNSKNDTITTDDLDYYYDE